MTLPPIALATNNGDIGGGEVMLLRLADALRSLDHAVTVVAPTQPSALADAAQDSGHDVTRLAATDRRSWMRALRRWDRTERNRIAPTLLWCNGLVPAAATAGRPTRIVHLHQAPRSTAQRAMVPLARAGAMATLVPSQYLQSVFPGAQVLPNWTPPIEHIARTRTDGEPYVVGYLGRLSTDKGVVTLADAMGLLAARDPGGYRLLIAGEPRFVDPNDYALVDRALATLGDTVVRPGWMERDEFFAQIDALVIPSIVKESFGLTAVEAMSAQVPLIVTRDGALPEVVGPAGVTVTPGDAAALAAAIDGVLRQPRSAHTAILHRRWAEHFSPDAGMRSVARLLDDLRHKRS